MLRSMTGDGRSENTREQADIVVEVKSSNHRYCDISLRMPQRCLALEAEIKVVSSEDGKGKISILFNSKADFKRLIKQITGA